MVSNLNTYPNLQYNGIKIPAFTVVEVYKDTIVKDNSLGYCIVPIEGMDNQTIEDTIREKVNSNKPEGYETCAVLNEGFDHKIVYAVWYKGEAPIYPTNEAVDPIENPIVPFDVYETLNIENQGTAPTALTLELECSSFNEPIEFYINDDYFKILIKNPSELSNIVRVDGTGVNYNNKNIDSFEFPTMPKIKNGLNCLRIKKTNVSKVKVKYTPKY